MSFTATTHQASTALAGSRADAYDISIPNADQRLWIKTVETKTLLNLSMATTQDGFRLDDASPIKPINAKEAGSRQCRCASPCAQGRRHGKAGPPPRPHDRQVDRPSGRQCPRRTSAHALGSPSTDGGCSTPTNRKYVAWDRPDRSTRGGLYIERSSICCTDRPTDSDFKRTPPREGRTA